MLEPFDDHPLEALAQHRFDRALQALRHLEEIRHRPHDARQRRHASLSKNGAHARAVTLARTLELRERLEARPASRQRDPRVRQRALRLGQATLLRRESGREPLPLAGERAELRLRGVTRLDEARAEGQDPRRLGLPQLARVPHEVDALGGDPHLLEPRRLGAVALCGEGLAVALEGGGERVRRAPPLLDEP